MTESTTTALHFAGIATILLAIVVFAWQARRNDRSRVASTYAHHELTPFDGDTATALEQVAGHAATSHRQDVDVLGLIGVGTVLTRRTDRSEIKVKSAHVNTWRNTRPEPGIVAVVRGTRQQVSRGLASRQSSSKGVDLVVARLARPIDGEVFVDTCEASIDPARVAVVARVMAMTGVTMSLLDDPDLNRSYIGRCDANARIAADTGLRALLWAARRHRGSTGTTPATGYYESQIPPMAVSQLRMIHIVGDMLVVAADSSPFQAGVRDELIELAAHLAANFR